jgi:hypothetical protein
VWLAVLSDQLPITALVGRHPANQLIGRRSLPGQPRRAFPEPPHRRPSTCGLTRRFRRLSPTPGQVPHAFLTRPPRGPPEGGPVRLACIRHAASVDPEPGSNSPPRPLQVCSFATPPSPAPVDFLDPVWRPARANPAPHRHAPIHARSRALAPSSAPDPHEDRRTQTDPPRRRENQP